MGAMLRCESHTERNVCDLNTNCSWDESSKQCERKSGSLATAMLEALPASKPALAPTTTCVETLVGTEQRCLKAGDSFKDSPDCPEMLVVPAGSFSMGPPDQIPVAVTFARPFAVARFAVTRGEFAAFVTATGHRMDGGCWRWFRGSPYEPPGVKMENSWREPGFTQTDRHPAVCVNWIDAKAYVAWLASVTKASYRLPSESGTRICYPGRHDIPDYSEGESRGATVPVESFAANPWGFYNVHGNIKEWTEDCWESSYRSTAAQRVQTSHHSDGSARVSNECRSRVTRGGSWSDHSSHLGSASCGFAAPNDRYTGLGFRVARTLTP
jgi:formylglycine-generating enzyme required for sulfatase activity